MLTDYVFVLPIIALAVLMLAAGLLLSHGLAPRKPSKLKQQTFECGEETIGSAWFQFKVGYYLFGLLFLVFDVEAAFLFPWAVILRETGLRGFLEILLFVFILLFGLFYAWRKGALQWE